VNGSAPDIQVVRPFSDAVELAKQILFRPFDLKKWFIIGFAAWLAHLGGGFNFNFNSNYRYDRSTGFHQVPVFRGFSDFVHRTPSWVIVVGAIVFVFLILALCILFAWLRSRGRFMFIDCIVRNRAAIAEPWREFRQLGNSFFLLSLLVALLFLLLGAVLAVPLMLLIGHRHHAHSYNVFLLCAVLTWAVTVFVLALAWAVISHFMIPIMYRRRIPAGEAFRATISLIGRYPDSVTLYCLFWILLIIGAAVVGCLSVCLTCCVVAIPYIGTVILLPMYVCLRGFSLLFLRQFGPDYDVWAALPSIAESIPPEPPPLPAA
jgi:hypothetical protein